VCACMHERSSSPADAHTARFCACVHHYGGSVTLHALPRTHHPCCI
jgi:hypothetical protein